MVLRLPSALAVGAQTLVTAPLTEGGLLDTDLVAFLIFAAAAAILNNHVGVADDEQGQPAGICTQLRKATVRSLFGQRQLSEQEIDSIADTGIEMLLRCYRYRPAQADV